MPQQGSGTYSLENIYPNGDWGHSTWRTYAPKGIGNIVLNTLFIDRADKHKHARLNVE